MKMNFNPPMPTVVKRAPNAAMALAALDDATTLREVAKTLKREGLWEKQRGKVFHAAVAAGSEEVVEYLLEDATPDEVQREYAWVETAQFEVAFGRSRDLTAATVNYNGVRDLLWTYLH
jgi:hypothetical protein